MWKNYDWNEGFIWNLMWRTWETLLCLCVKFWKLTFPIIFVGDGLRMRFAIASCTSALPQFLSEPGRNFPGKFLINIWLNRVLCIGTTWVHIDFRYWSLIKLPYFPGNVMSAFPEAQHLFFVAKIRDFCIKFDYDFMHLTHVRCLWFSSRFPLPL